jgi:exopolysaccharide biosynthesis protein
MKMKKPISRILITLFVFVSLFTPERALSQITDLTQEVIKPGLIHHRFVKNLPRGPVVINILEIDTQKGFVIKPALAQKNTIWSKATVAEIAVREDAIAGINANYFNGRGMPIGSLAIDREWITGPVFQRASVSIDKEGRLSFARPKISGNLAVYKNTPSNVLSAAYHSGSIPALTLRVSNINQPEALSQNSISFFNHWWQDKISCGNGKSCVLIDGNGIVRKRVFTYDERTSIQPTRTDYVLSALSDEKFSSIALGDKVKLSWSSQPDWSNVTHVVGGGPYLVSKGEIILDEKLEGFTSKSGISSVAPRTAIGMTSPGRLIWLIADGRQKDSVGMTLWELSSLLKEIGVTEGINMDGGGSSAMYLNGRIINSPSDAAGPRRVSTALLLMNKSNEYRQSPWLHRMVEGEGGP